MELAWELAIACVSPEACKRTRAAILTPTGPSGECQVGFGACA